MHNEVTVGELIEMLKDYPESAQVKIAIQPSWPMEHSLDRNVGPTVLVEPEQYQDDESYDENTVVYLIASDDGDYLPELARKEIGW